MDIDQLYYNATTPVQIEIPSTTTLKNDLKCEVLPQASFSPDCTIRL